MKPHLIVLFTFSSAATELTGTLLLPPSQAELYLQGDQTAAKVRMSEHIADSVLQHHEAFKDLGLAGADDATLREARRAHGVVVGLTHVTVSDVVMVGDPDVLEAIERAFT